MRSVAVGGTDTGPTPYELLPSAPAACTTITVSMYAQRKGWDVQRIEVAYDHDRVNAKDCPDCEDHQEGFIDRITSDVTITGDLDVAQQQRLAELATSCPVDRTPTMSGRPLPTPGRSRAGSPSSRRAEPKATAGSAPCGVAGSSRSRA
jgi:uncharacterized OsmC-like protein